MKMEEIAEELVNDFLVFDDWMDKYEHLIELGKELPAIREEHKIDSNLIKGCQSRVWLNVEVENNTMLFTADSDAIITKGIIALLLKVVNNQTKEEVLNFDFDFINQIGLSEHLSPTRANGLVSMIKKIKEYALNN